MGYRSQLVKAKSAARRETMFRKIKLRLAIWRMMRDNKELLERLGSDYDENGIPYWEKTGTVDPDYDR